MSVLLLDWPIIYILVYVEHLVLAQLGSKDFDKWTAFLLQVNFHAECSQSLTKLS